jgi:hypothetical protein
VCLFRGLDATKANLRRYQRAASDLLVRHLMRSDYRRLDPNRDGQAMRTYSIWIPRPERFEFVGSAEENAVNLWPPRRADDGCLSVSGFVALLEGDNVALQSNVSNGDTITSDEEQSDNVALVVEQNVRGMSSPHQRSEKPSSREKDTPIPQRGHLSSPAPLKGGALKRRWA